MTRSVEGARFVTYRTFPPELYEKFLRTYVTPFSPDGTPDVIDLGCGSGGMLEQLLGLYPKSSVIGVDISPQAIDACRQRPALHDGRARLVQEDMMGLVLRPDYKGRFGLVTSYSVLHIVPGPTPPKFHLLRYLTRPGAIVAVDALPRVPWNAFLFVVLKILFRLRIATLAIRVLGPFVAPNMPKDYIKELSRLDYMKFFRVSDFLDLGYLETEEFRAAFELLRFDIKPQDGFFTGRKARFVLRRKG
ncbi:MAG: class I SAM-dependent methyltransferase [Elusimicrobia bacterium]|nr:class I SAM-dependent methyltransferase [Elusimicrobiota bacterium]